MEILPWRQVEMLVLGNSAAASDWVDVPEESIATVEQQPPPGGRLSSKTLPLAVRIDGTDEVLYAPCQLAGPLRFRAERQGGGAPVSVTCTIGAAS